MGEDFNFDAAPAAPKLSFGAEEPAAAQAQEAIAVDSTSFGKIIEEEIERIKQKNQNT